MKSNQIDALVGCEILCISPQVFFIHRFMTVKFNSPLSHSDWGLFFTDVYLILMLYELILLLLILPQRDRWPARASRQTARTRRSRSAAVKRALPVKTRTQSRCFPPDLPSLYRLLVQFCPVWFRCFKLLSSAILTPVQNNRTRLTSRAPLHSCAFVALSRPRAARSCIHVWMDTSFTTSSSYSNNERELLWSENSELWDRNSELRDKKVVKVKKIFFIRWRKQASKLFTFIHE